MGLWWCGLTNNMPSGLTANESWLVKSLKHKFTPLWEQLLLSFRFVSLQTCPNTSLFFNFDYLHDDVIKWKHLPRYWPFVREIHRSRPVTRSFDVFFGLHLNKRLSKQPWGWWFETPSRSLWRHCNVHLYDPYSDPHTMQGWAESSAWHTSIVENTTIHSQ